MPDVVSLITWYLNAIVENVPNYRLQPKEKATTHNQVFAHKKTKKKWKKESQLIFQSNSRGLNGLFINGSHIRKRYGVIVQ